MKNAAFFFFLSLAVPSLSAQSNCDFQKLVNDGKAATKKEQYELALNKFNAARRCDPEKGKVIDTEVQKLFGAINQKKKQAEAARDSVAGLLQKFEAAGAEIVDAFAREAGQCILKMEYPVVEGDDRVRRREALSRFAVSG